MTSEQQIQIEALKKEGFFSRIKGTKLNPKRHFKQHCGDERIEKDSIILLANIEKNERILTDYQQTKNDTQVSFWTIGKKHSYEFNGFYDFFLETLLEDIQPEIDEIISRNDKQSQNSNWSWKVKDLTNGQWKRITVYLYHGHMSQFKWGAEY